MTDLVKLKRRPLAAMGMVWRYTPECRQLLTELVAFFPPDRRTTVEPAIDDSDCLVITRRQHDGPMPPIMRQLMHQIVVPGDWIVCDETGTVFAGPRVDRHFVPDDGEWGWVKLPEPPRQATCPICGSPPAKEPENLASHAICPRGHLWDQLSAAILHPVTRRPLVCHECGFGPVRVRLDTPQFECPNRHHFDLPTVTPQDNAQTWFHQCPICGDTPIGGVSDLVLRSPGHRLAGTLSYRCIKDHSWDPRTGVVAERPQPSHTITLDPSESAGIKHGLPGIERPLKPDDEALVRSMGIEPGGGERGALAGEFIGEFDHPTGFVDEDGHPPSDVPREPGIDYERLRTIIKGES